MAGNEYMTQAELYLRGVSAEDSATPTALLALAYEQRTANLIALISGTKIDWDQRQLQTIAETVLARLDITLRERVR